MASSKSTRGNQSPVRLRMPSRGKAPPLLSPGAGFAASFDLRLGFRFRFRLRPWRGRAAIGRQAAPSGVDRQCRELAGFPVHADELGIAALDTQIDAGAVVRLSTTDAAG